MALYFYRMQHSPYHPSQWKKFIPNIDEAIAKMEATPILAVGITPYVRIIPSFFLKNYSIYTIRNSADTKVMADFAHMHVLEDFHPDIAKKVHGTSYLIGNYAFQSFLKSRRTMPKLLLNTINKKSIETLNGLNTPWIGNPPHVIDDVVFKKDFRELIRILDLPSLPSHIYPCQDFLSCTFENLWSQCEGPFVIQRGDKEVGGNEGTFFIHDVNDYHRSQVILGGDKTFEHIVATPYIEGYSTSMLGCIVPQGVLTGPLQLQLIDVPQSLHGVPPNGIFFGNDIGFHPWGSSIEETAQNVVEKIGEHLRSKGYRGIFGIDFLYDKNRDEILPNECNPRFPGSLTLYSLMLLQNKLPPLEFFDLAAHLDIPLSFNFDEVNRALKRRIPCAHVAFSPKGILNMGLPLEAGVYSYDTSGPSLSYVRPGVSLADIKNENEFLLIDTVPKMGGVIEQQVPRMFKFIFPRSIAKSSYEIDGVAEFLVERFSQTLLEASQKEIPTSY